MDKKEGFFKRFFSSSNDINESIVIGVPLVALFIAGAFLPQIPADKYNVIGYVIIGLFTGASARSIVDAIGKRKGNP